MNKLLKMWLTNMAGLIGFFLIWIGGGYLISSLGGSYAISLGLSTLLTGIFVILGVGFSSKWNKKEMFSNKFSIWKMLFMVWAVPTFIGGSFYLLQYIGSSYILAALIPMVILIATGIYGYKYFNDKDKCPRQKK